MIIFETIKEQVADMNPDALFADGFDSALIGYQISGSDRVAVYDFDMMVKALMDNDEMEEIDAIEYIEYNVLNAYVGQYTPIVIKTLS